MPVLSRFFRCSVLISLTKLLGRPSPPTRFQRQNLDDASLRAYAAKISGLDQERFLAAFTSLATKDSIQREGDVSAIEFAVRAAGMKAQDAIYAYAFSAEIPGWDHPGAFHSVDLWFFFETLAKCWRPFTGKHYDLARQMCDCLYNFVHSGDPNGIGTDGGRLPYRPKLEPQEPIFMSFGDAVKPLRSPADPVIRLLPDAYLASGEN